MRFAAKFPDWEAVRHFGAKLLSGFLAKFLYYVLLFAMALTLVTCASNSTLNINMSSNVSNLDPDPQVLNVWWSQGFLPEENEFVIQLLKAWEQETGKKAKLSLISESNIIGEVKKAIAVGRTPDFLFNFGGDFDLFPVLAWRNQLADVSSIIQTKQKDYTPNALEAVRYYNNVTKKRSYYAIPIAQQGFHVHYWSDLLKTSGLDPQAIPQDWHQFWQFWQKAQLNLRQKGVNGIYGMGISMSTSGNDNFWAVEHFLEAYDLQLVDTDGNLKLDDPKVKPAIAAALKELSDFYRAGVIPPSALTWNDADNNVSMLSRESMMTVNPSLSIPLTQNQPKNIYNTNSRDRYFHKMVTIPLPRKINQKPMRSLVSVKQAVMFEASQNKEACRSFINYLLRTENLNKFLKDTSKGRIYPVMQSLIADPFWHDPTDPHKSSVAKQFQNPTRPFAMVYNAAYAQVAIEHLWGKAINSIIKDNVSPEQAAATTIKNIKKIFTEWT